MKKKKIQDEIRREEKSKTKTTAVRQEREERTKLKGKKWQRRGEKKRQDKTRREGLCTASEAGQVRRAINAEEDRENARAPQWLMAKPSKQYSTFFNSLL